MTEPASLPAQFWFGVAHYLPLIAFAAMSWAVGRRLTRRLSYRNEFEAAVLSTALGWGVLGLSFFLLATAGLFSTPWILLLLGGSQLASYRSWVEAPVAVQRWWASKAARRRTLIAVALLVVFLPLLALPLYPPIAFDSLMYHLPMARSIVEQQGIDFFPDLRYPVFPALQETLFAAGLLLTNDITPALTHFAGFLGVALLIYCWGDWLSSRRTGLLAALLWIGTLSAVLNGSSPYVDCTLTLFLTAAIFCLHRYFRRREIGWLLVSAAFTGFAAGTKYHALFFLGVLALAMLAVTLRHRRYRHLIGYGVVLTLVTLPWYLFIYLESGNPVHPFYPQIFGRDDWSYQLRRARRMTEPATEEAPVRSSVTLARILAEQMGDRLVLTPVKSLRLPIDVFLHPRKFRGRALSPFYLYALLGLAAMTFRFRRARWALLLVGLYFTFLSVTQIDLRYVLPILPLIAVFGAEGVDRLLGWMTPSSRGWIAIVLTIAVALPLGHRAHKIASGHFRGRGPIPTDAYHRYGFIQPRLNQYRAVQALNRKHEGDYRLYGLFCENLRYYVDGTLLGDWFGPAKYRLVLHSLHDPEALHRVLRDMDVDYLLVPNLRRWKQRKFRFSTPRPEAMRSHFKIVYRSKLSVIYRLRRHPRPSEPEA